MTRSQSIAVTGATGGLGGRVARRLAQRGVAQRLVVRDPSRAPGLAHAEVAVATYGDAAAMRAALRGIEVLYLVSGAEHPDRLAQHRTAIDAAAAADVGHIVYVSFVGAAAEATFTFARDHWHTEQHLAAAGVPHTVLRSSLYADFLPRMAGPDDVVRGPAGDGRVAPVARDDAADAAVAVLLHESLRGRAYDLTGPQLLTFAEAVAITGEATGRPLRYHAETIEEAYASRASYGAPDWEVAGWVTTYAAIAAGELAVLTDHVERLTGHPATGLAALLHRL